MYIVVSWWKHNLLSHGSMFSSLVYTAIVVFMVSVKYVCTDVRKNNPTNPTLSVKNFVGYSFYDD